ncbi:Gfo/Idh/MocA family protein [Dyadobacter sediminis]|uniref:Gfo/Idh/MocA family oxidoreductase n=1 Tax=Dyadobacter sediminis TaxID=1493691 RepID=A0A5R9K8X2_9BACT|nr:Gfo/Idh/MocA family oxidoreductase [Dyadobacter sediminis]TLU90549.1 gfo/Idh/MocA family oxidoreductase [Dyadobacter sediminis]GGC08699.1 dehydrogenase [Dyadobacter sediminis]
MHILSRRRFIQRSVVTGVGLNLLGHFPSEAKAADGKRVGIIGLDTSHSIAFTKALNAEQPDAVYDGYRVTAAYPYGSKDIESSTKRIPGYIDEVKKLGVEITGSIKELLGKSDVILLETNDGRLHLEQALEVFKAGKRMFIDKPVAGTLKDTLAIYEASEKYKIPVFSASSLRYMKGIESIDKSKVLGADTYSPAVLEKTHPDFFWYGIHGIEALYTVMGTGCKSVTRVSTPDTDIVVGIWEDGRTGTFRGTRTGKHDYGGTVFTQDGNKILGPYGGYEPLLKDIIKYFQTGEVPVTSKETIEIFTFMEAADESKRQGGKNVTLESVMSKARKK